VARGSQVNLRDELFHVGGRSPLHHATLSGNTELVRFLLDEGADLNVEDNHIKTAYHYAAGHGFIPILEMLLDAKDGKDVINRRYEGSPLHEATQSNHVAAVKLLLRAGAHIDPPADIIQTTPLHLAARLGSHEIAQLLIDHGADACKRYEFPYESPLQIATVEGHETVVLTLLNYMTEVRTILFTQSPTLLTPCNINRLIKCSKQWSGPSKWLQATIVT
jgi:ankyrin repeat protein